MPEVVQTFIKVNGSDIDQALNIISIEVESALGYPDTFTVSFIDTDIEVIENSLNTFKPGNAIEIAFQNDADDAVVVFNGEITMIAPEFGMDFSATLVVSGYDKRHRLMRGTKSRAFVNVSDSDIVGQIARDYGLSPQVDSTSPVHEHVFQDNQSDMDFIDQLARRNGYQVYVEGSKLHFKKPTVSQSTVDLDWGETLFSFTARLSTARQVDEVIVRGWDSAQNQAIVGTAKTSSTHPEINVGGSGGAVAKKAFGAAQYIEVRQPVASQSEAEKIAQSILDEINAEFVEANGTADGNPKLIAGVDVNIAKVGDKFSGKYHLTNAKHYLMNGIYTTDFRVEGTQPYLLGGILNSASGQNEQDFPLWTGIYPAIVTNNNDPDNSNRVKLKYPWLDDDVESHWGRVITIGAGSGMGLHWLPEVNDEVLVAFEHGNFNRPYILGSVYSGTHALPEDVQADKAIDVRVMQSRSGHKLVMNDTSGSEHFTIYTKSGHFIKLDDANKKVEIESSGGKKITIDDNGNSITIEGAETVNVKSSGALNVEAGGTLKLKGSSKVEVSAPTVEVSGSMMVEVKAPSVKIG